MKLQLLSFLLIVISVSGPSHAQTTGGPDLYGYHWANNLDPIGSAPVYSWKDIKDTANLVKGLGDDNSSGPYNLGFYYAYYGKWYNTLWIGSNGWVSFQQLGNISAPFLDIPTTDAPDNFIAGMLADLTLKDAKSAAVPGAAVYYWTNKKDSVVIQYDSIPFWDSSATGYSGRNTFQVMLVGGSEYSITFQYKHIINSTPSYNLDVTGLKVGIEDSTGETGLQVLDTFPSDSSAVKFYYPGHFSTNDLDNTSLSLSQNFPNPCSASTQIQYALTKNENVSIAIQNMLGEQVASFPLGNKPAGSHSFSLNTSTLSPGIYFYTLATKEKAATRKMIVVK